MLKAFQDLLDLAKATPRQMPRDNESGLPVDRMAHFRAAFKPRISVPGKPKPKYEPKKKETDEPKLTLRQRYMTAKTGNA